MTARVETIGAATLYLGDCAEVMAGLEKKEGVDCVITDPPYGVNFQYSNYVDSSENWELLILPRISKALAIATKCAAVFCSHRHYFKMPTPLWVICWLKRGSVRHMRGGNFAEWEPVFIYGAANFPSDVIDLPDITSHVDGATGHPCPKPLKLMDQLISGFGEKRTTSVFDPFMGSGTTGVAAVTQGRRFIGVEIDPKYFDVACERLEAAQAQGRLFA